MGPRACVQSPTCRAVTTNKLNTRQTQNRGKRAAVACIDKSLKQNKHHTDRLCISEQPQNHIAKRQSYGYRRAVLSPTFSTSIYKQHITTRAQKETQRRHQGNKRFDSNMQMFGMKYNDLNSDSKAITRGVLHSLN